MSADISTVVQSPRAGPQLIIEKDFFPTGVFSWPGKYPCKNQSFFVAQSLPLWIANHAIMICYTIHLLCLEHMNLLDAGANPADTLPVLTSL
jgi:hypothetical protein